MKKLLKYHVIGIITAFVIVGCVEELDVVSVVATDGAGLLVVEASISDELKRQRVYLSRTDARFDLQTDTIYNPFIPLGQGPRDSVNFEENARVRFIASNGAVFDFMEEEKGTYLSESAFAIEPNLNYTLEVVTSGGVEYISNAVQISGTSNITDVYAERTTSDTGVDGIQVYVDSNPLNGNTANYRYTYEETYKIIAPFWNRNDFRLTNYDPCALPVPTYDLDIIEREIQNQVCYNTVVSNTVIQTTSGGRPGNSITRFPIRFIGRDNFIISHRYSILVKQLVQSSEAYSFYETVQKFANSENLFSQVQPGALVANVNRADGIDENVLGYVEAVSVSERRLFFDYEDFFPNEDLPPYPFNCSEQSAPESHTSYCFDGLSGGGCPQSIIEQVNLGLITYTGNNDENLGLCPGPYKFVARICGDCTLLGENTIPEFWEE